MQSASEQFHTIEEQLLSEANGVEKGKMMREPALKFRGKVFCFFWEDRSAMCFRLGKGFAIEETGVREYSFLDPFRHKPPMTAWFVIPDTERVHWGALAIIALEQIMGN